MGQFFSKKEEVRRYDFDKMSLQELHQHKTSVVSFNNTRKLSQKEISELDSALEKKSVHEGEPGKNNGFKILPSSGRL